MDLRNEEELWREAVIKDFKAQNKRIAFIEFALFTLSLSVAGLWFVQGLYK